MTAADTLSTTLVHAVRPASAPEGAKPPALILLHGRGTNENDLLELADYLDPRFFIISVRAPYPFEGVGGAFTWFDLQGIGRPDVGQFMESYRRLVQFIADVKQKYPVDPDRIFLLGFSMGSMMALSVALSKPQLVRGVVAHSGYIPESIPLKFVWDQLRGLSLFVAHGIDDPVLPIAMGRRAHELLSTTEADLTYREYPIPHTISEESIADIGTWFQKVLDVPRDMK